MSGECYSAKNIHMELNSTRKEKVLELKHDSHKRDEVEHLKYDGKNSLGGEATDVNTQIERIERIKQYFNDQTGASDSKSSKAKSSIQSGMESFADSNPMLKPLKRIRQNSQAISTDTTGAPLGTINNILAGITKPVTLSDFYYKGKASTTKSSSKVESDCQEQIRGVENVKINSKSKHVINVRSKTKFKAKKSRSKIATITSSTELKKLKKPVVKVFADKKHQRGSDTRLAKIISPMISKRSKRMIVQHTVRAEDTPRTHASGKSKSRPNPDLVEIYHNNAVKQSKSSESDMTKLKPVKNEPRARTNVDLVPPLIIGENDMKAARGVVSCIYKNYAMPTIASRMKQAAKYYMNSFNIRTIPFCLSTSTSPSHNIGINIQQVMSMVKSKQPVGRLSPTLAYNIGLAARKKEDNCFPFLVSSVTSRNLNSQCPLMKNYNYQYLQEAAKTVTQDTIEETEEIEDTNSPETQSMIITGPSGDVKVVNKKQTIWTMDSDVKKCTCITPKGIAFQQIVDKFNGPTPKNKTFNKQLSLVPKKVHEKNINRSGSGEAVAKLQVAECTPLQNKERKLKEVLTKLHDEFEGMTKTYDDLVKKSEEGNTDCDTTKALEALDKQLNSKEEEIVMVMSLYKEVLALKQQVKSLKDRTSKENITYYKNHPSKFNGVNNITTAGLLNQLLQRVQHFQSHYKRH